MSWITIISCISFLIMACKASYEIGKTKRGTDRYQQGWNDARSFYRPMAKGRIKNDMSIKKEQLN